jgi:uncharacterized membrane protein YraQ (UPF0718 family)
MFAVFAALALASAISPAGAFAHFAGELARARMGALYWCSMLFGAAPFLAAGSLTAVCTATVLRGRRSALLAGAALLPGCDCSINALAHRLRTLPGASAAFAVLWGACCNPLTLATTYVVLGMRAAGLRALCGLAAAAATACVWMFLARTRRECAAPSNAPGRSAKDGFAQLFLQAFSHGLASFSAAAAVAAIVLACGMPRVANTSAAAAAALGAILSPCSISDSLLARVLFSAPKCQLAFVVAAQLLDLRQTVVLAQTFGARKTVFALIFSAAACALGCALA